MLDSKTAPTALSRSMGFKGCSIEPIDALLNQVLIRRPAERANSGFADPYQPQRLRCLPVVPAPDERTIATQLPLLQAASPEQNMRRGGLKNWALPKQAFPPLFWPTCPGTQRRF